jgi:hypothetical protein
VRKRIASSTRRPVRCSTTTRIRLLVEVSAEKPIEEVTEGVLRVLESR